MNPSTPLPLPYRGRLAPSPTGFLHLGHARTFWIAQERARQHHGRLILRSEDIDRPRCKPEFAEAMMEDLRWFGFHWDEGPDLGGDFGPYRQSERFDRYRQAFRELRDQGRLYPCSCSRKDILQALQAPHESADEPIYPGTCRHRPASDPEASRCHWRFRVPDGAEIRFNDIFRGPQRYVAGQDFGDFIIWRNDDLPSYQLAVVVDDGAMQISEVVRGQDLLRSTARQLLLYRALHLTPPQFCHCPLMLDDQGERLAKRHAALTLRTLRETGSRPEELRASWSEPETSDRTGAAPGPPATSRQQNENQVDLDSA